MITDKQTIIAKTKYADMYPELFKKYLIGWIIVIALGLGGLILGIVLVLGNDVLYGVPIIISSAIVIVACLCLIVLYSVATHKGRADKKANEVEIFGDCAVFTAYMDGQTMGVERVIFSDIVKKEETKSYFIIQGSLSQVYPIGKTGLSDEEIKTVRRLLKFNVKDEPSLLPPLYSSETERTENENE